MQMQWVGNWLIPSFVEFSTEKLNIFTTILRIILSLMNWWIRHILFRNRTAALACNFSVSWSSTQFSQFCIPTSGLIAEIIWCFLELTWLYSMALIELNQITYISTRPTLISSHRLSWNNRHLLSNAVAIELIASHWSKLRDYRLNWKIKAFIVCVAFYADLGLQSDMTANVKKKWSKIRHRVKWFKLSFSCSLFWSGKQERSLSTNRIPNDSIGFYSNVLLTIVSCCAEGSPGPMREFCLTATVSSHLSFDIKSTPTNKPSQ